MLFKQSFSLVGRGLFPDKTYPGMPQPPIKDLKESAIPYIAKAKSLDNAIQQLLVLMRVSKGISFAIYHIPGKHSVDELTQLVQASGNIHPSPVWQDESKKNVFDLIVDYSIPAKTYGVENMVDWLKLKTFTINDAILAARTIVATKGGAPSTIHHILGNNSFDELKEISGGTRACVARLVWYDEDEVFSTLTVDDLKESIIFSATMTPAEHLAINLLFESSGPESLGVFLPPVAPKFGEAYDDSW